jgi:hypothetical protein
MINIAIGTRITVACCEVKSINKRKKENRQRTKDIMKKPLRSFVSSVGLPISEAA